MIWVTKTKVLDSGRYLIINISQYYSHVKAQIPENVGDRLNISHISRHIVGLNMWNFSANEMRDIYTRQGLKGTCSSFIPKVTIG